MASIPWTKIYWSDFLGDTLQLDAQEVGIYFLMLAHYYQRALPIPDDKQVIYRITRATTAADRNAVHRVLDQYFVLCDGHWWNRRADKEIANRKKQQSNGKKGGRPRLVHQNE